MHGRDAPAGGDEVVVHHLVEMLFELSDGRRRIVKRRAVRGDQDIGLRRKDAVEAGFDLRDCASETPITGAHFGEFFLEPEHLPDRAGRANRVAGKATRLPAISTRYAT